MNDSELDKKSHIILKEITHIKILTCIGGIRPADARSESLGMFSIDPCGVASSSMTAQSYTGQFTFLLDSFERLFTRVVNAV